MSNHRVRVCLLAIVLVFFGGSVLLTPQVLADDTNTGEFSLQITPSPLVATLKPGIATTLELKIRNGGSGTENLKIEPRSFTVDKTNGQVELSDTAPSGIATWIHFSQPTFTVLPGQWETEQIHLDVPADAGFSYSFALLISRVSTPTVTSGRVIKGSIAEFALINIDRPGAVSSLSLASITTTKHFYQYLPATIQIQFKNNGNTIVQPTGNVFVGRNATGTPLGTLPVNQAQAYILPGVTRTLTASWSDGFPAYQSIQNADGTTSQHLSWNFSKLSHFRIGRYTAHVVAIYSDGSRDVPIEGTVSFWVIPWKILLVLLVVLLLLGAGLWVVIRPLVRSLIRRKNHRPSASPPSQ